MEHALKITTSYGSKITLTSNTDGEGMTLDTEDSNLQGLFTFLTSEEVDALYYFLDAHR